MKKCFLFYILLMLIVSVNATERQKLNFNMSYNTEASFAFDQQNIKINYNMILWKPYIMKFCSINIL